MHTLHPMSATLHLRPIPGPAIAVDLPAKLDAAYLVILRSNGHWSPGAKIISVHETEGVAEAIAASLHIKNPQQIYGVWKLRSEARAVAIPVEIVRATDDDLKEH